MHFFLAKNEFFAEIKSVSNSFQGLSIGMWCTNEIEYGISSPNLLHSTVVRFHVHSTNVNRHGKKIKRLVGPGPCPAKV